MRKLLIFFAPIFGITLGFYLFESFLLVKEHGLPNLFTSDQPRHCVTRSVLTVSLFVIYTEKLYLRKKK